MQCESPTQITRLCYDVARSYQVEETKVPVWERVGLLLGTSAVETGFMRSPGKATGRIPGLGLWNINLYYAMKAFSEEFDHGWRFWSSGSMMSWAVFLNGWLGISSVKVFIPSQREMRYLLVNDDRFSCAMAMWLYFGKLDNLGQNLSEMADFWYRNYPTDHAKREPSDFLDAWSECGCEILIRSLGYQ